MTEPEVGIDEVPFLPFEDAQQVVTASLNACEDAAKRRDHESAHDAEDKTWEAALTWISEQGDQHSKALAWQALRTQNLSFQRWYS